MFFKAIKSDGKVAIDCLASYTSENNYVRAPAEDGGNHRRLQADRKAIGGDEKFNFESHGEYTAIKASNGKYCQIENGQSSGRLFCNANAVGSWERFKLFKLTSIPASTPYLGGIAKALALKWSVLDGNEGQQREWCNNTKDTVQKKVRHSQLDAPAKKTELSTGQQVDTTGFMVER